MKREEQKQDTERGKTEEGLEGKRKKEHRQRENRLLWSRVKLYHATLLAQRCMSFPSKTLCEWVDFHCNRFILWAW